jgi:hypothetical protein
MSLLYSILKPTVRKAVKDNKHGEDELISLLKYEGGN